MSEPRATHAEADPNHVLATPFVGVAVMFLLVRVWDWWVPAAWFHHGMALIGLGGVAGILATMRLLRRRGHVRGAWVLAHGEPATATITRVSTVRRGQTHVHLQFEATITPEGGRPAYPVLHEQRVPLAAVDRVSALQTTPARLHPTENDCLVLDWEKAATP